MKNKIYFLLVLFTILCFLYTTVVFSKQSTTGSFLQGFAGGFESGFNMAQKSKKIKLEKEQQKKLKYEKIKIQESINVFINLMKQYGVDAVYSEDEKLELNKAFLSFTPEVQVILKDINNAIQSMWNILSEL